MPCLTASVLTYCCTQAVLVEELRACDGPCGADAGRLLRALRLCERFLAHAQGSRKHLAVLKADVQAALSQPVRRQCHPVRGACHLEDI